MTIGLKRCEYAPPAFKRGYPGFAERISLGDERQDCGGSHILTTPYEGRTIGGGLEDICGSVDIGVGGPTARASLGAASFAVGSSDLTAGMASLRRIGFADLNDLDTAQPGLVLDPTGDLSERPGMETLVEMIAVVDFLADVGQVADGDGVHSGFIATLEKFLGDQVEPMVDLAGLLAFDLAEVSST